MESFVQEQDQSEHSLWAYAEQESIQAALQAAHGLALLQDVLAGEPAQAILDLLQSLAARYPDPASVALAYSDAFSKLAVVANEETMPSLTDAWQAYLAGCLIDNRNPWSVQVEGVGLERASSTLRAQARRDLRTLQRLFELDAQTLWRIVDTLVSPALPALHDAWTPWLELAPAPDRQEPDARELLAAQLTENTDWTTLVEPLETYWSRYGTGELARYHVLYWQSLEKQLSGVAHPDPIRLTSLVTQERQQVRLMTNIRRFLAGLPAQDMLLYGPPGTGKSSTVKALANTYAAQGLCLVEVSKGDIGELPLVVAQLRGRAPRYLLFIDDLSFEEHETAYKALKVMLEGTASARPANVLICATSNRLNLIRENFNERGNPTEDVNWRDTMDEKQSLAHRFALRVTFMSPDQQQYLRIVENLAQQRGLELSTEILQERALNWERQHTGRSGRVARQFIDDLEAELKYG